MRNNASTPARRTLRDEKRNRAIIIGIDNYRSIRSLYNGVRDALDMYRWLTGNKEVRPEDVTLLLAPDSPDRLRSMLAERGLQEDLEYKEPTGDAINAAIRGLRGLSGDRLFFHFAGHGVSGRIDFDDKSALVASDFSVDDTNKSLRADSLSRYLKCLDFADQFIWLDCCRDRPPTLPEEYLLGEIPVPQRARRDVAEPQQFIYYATQSLREATDGISLTQVLLEALGGKGRAKEFVEPGGPYRVTCALCFAYLLARFREMQQGLSEEDPMYQMPREAGERGRTGRSPNPILAAIPPDQTERIELTIKFSPEAARQGASLKIRPPSVDTAESIVVARSGPVVVPLLPRTYYLQASSAAYRPREPVALLDLYEPLSKDLVFDSLAGGTTRGIGGGREASDTGRGPSAAGPAHGEPRDEIWSRSSPPGRIVLTCVDPYAPLELADALGQVVKVARGQLECTDLAPGKYRGRIRAPEGVVVEEMIFLEPGGNVEVKLQAPPRSRTALVDDLIEKVVPGGPPAGRPSSDGWLELLASASTTLLSLASSSLNKDQDIGLRPERLGLKSFAQSVGRQARSGLEVLSSVEGHDPAATDDFRRRLRFGVAPLVGREPEATESATPADNAASVSSFCRALEPGSYQFSVAIPPTNSRLDGQMPSVPTVFAIVVLPGHLTKIILQLNARGEIRVLQQMPSLDPSVPANPHLLRWIDLAQRFLIEGRLDHAEAELNQILGVLFPGKMTDPIAGCLGLDIAARVGLEDRHWNLEQITGNMVRLYDGFADAHVQRAMFLEAEGRDGEARAEYARALDLGLPVYAPCLEALAAAATRLKLEHPRIRLLKRIAKRRVLSVLWTAWVPQPAAP
jgi:hypothetical protein